MAKFALLIGISEYEPGLNALPAAVKDIEALRRVLQDPEMGGFDNVKTLANPDRQTMESEIETLFDGRAKDDLVLLFFSGHGIKDDSSTLYFASRNTRKNAKGDLIRSTAVETRFVHNIMNNSRAKRQAIILDCCFSGAFDPAFQSKDDGSVDLQTQLGAEGRVVLTSSSSTQYSFEQQGSDLSIYTRYLVEGIETGAGDTNSDGFVSMLELHEYAASKVRETAPKMTPKIIVLKDKGFEIVLAKARVTDPKLKYRKTATRYANAGTIRPAGRAVLNTLRQQLGLTLEEATEIEAEVLRPYQERLVSLQQYRETLIAEAEHEYPLGEFAREDLNTLQQMLGLRDEDILPIQQEVEAQFTQQSATYQQSLIQYEQALTDAIQREFPFSQQTRQGLESLQQSLRLRGEDVARVEQPLIQQAEVRYQEKLRQEVERQRQEQEKTEYENRLQRYKQEFTKAIQGEYPLNEFVVDGLRTFQQQLGLKDEEAARIEQSIREPVEAKYREKLKQQEQAEQQQKRELGERRKAALEKRRQEAERQTQEQEKAEYENKLRRYEQEFTKAIQGEYPLNEFVVDGLRTFQQQLGLKRQDVTRVEQALIALKEAELQTKEAAKQKQQEATQQKQKLVQPREESHVNLKRQEAETYIEMGMALCDQDKLDEAISAFRKAIQVDPNIAESHVGLGTTLKLQNKIGEAISAFRKAIQVDPNIMESHASLGYLLHCQGKLDEAISAYHKAIQIDPDHIDVYCYLGNAFGDQGKLDEAISAYHKAIQIDPNYAHAYSNLGCVLEAQGNLNEAISANRKAIQLDPNNANAYNNLGSALKKQGKLDEAISAYHKAIQIDPNHAHAYNNLGVALKAEGKLDEAISSHRKAIQLDPNNATMRHNLETTLKEQRQGKKFLGLF